jgi:WD40 repeat protein
VELHLAPMASSWPLRPKITQLSCGDQQQAMMTLYGHKGSVLSVAYSPNGWMLASGSEDGTAKIWEIASGKERVSFDCQTESVSSVIFSPNGKLLATAGYSNVVTLWDIETGQRNAVLQAKGYVVAFSRDGQMLAVGGRTSGSGTVALCSADTGKIQRRFKGHEAALHSEVQALAFSPNGKMLASASNDGTIKLWDVATGEERVTLVGHTGFVYTVAFDAMGRFIASGGNDKCVKLWDVPVPTRE